jgi:hypothetical protein
MEVFKRYFGVWECRSVEGKQVATAARHSYPGSIRNQHEYQRLIGQLLACDKAEAEVLALNRKTVSEAKE